LDDWKADSVAVRVENNTAGLRFLNISRDDRQKILDLFG
jgi:hypothetical protein